MQALHDLRILVVDDEPELLQMVKELLIGEGFSKVEVAATVAQALSLAEKAPPQALILDVMLPDGNGFDLLKELRRRQNLPALFLSARDEDESRLRGLRLGADDYITKPFLPKELALRLSAVLRRCYQLGDTDEALPISLGPVQVDLGSGTVTGNGEEKTLTAKEYAQLKKLNENRGRIVTIDSLCQAAWNDQSPGYENTLMVHMRRLREKIEPEPSHPRFLITVRGLGYRLLKEDAQ